MILFILVVSFLSILLESAVTTLPLLFIIVTVLIIFKRQVWIYGLAFIGGLVIDSATVRPLGVTSIFLVCWLFLILLYTRKYNIDSYPFVIASTFTGGLVYLTIFGYEMVLQQSLTGSLLALIFFLFLRVTDKKTEKYKLV